MRLKQTGVDDERYEALRDRGVRILVNIEKVINEPQMMNRFGGGQKLTEGMDSVRGVGP